MIATNTDTICPPCRDAAHPYEHRGCLHGVTDGHTDPIVCTCQCRNPLPRADRAARRPSVNPRAMLDHSEITVGCWVANWVPDGLDYDVEAGRSGIVIDIDRVVDDGTGEAVRVYSVARLCRGKVRWHRLSEADVVAIDVPDHGEIRRLWRAMCAEVGRKKRAVQTEEMRLIETAHLLMRSVA